MFKDSDKYNNYISNMELLSDNITEINIINYEINNLIERRDRLLSNQDIIYLRLRINK